MLSLVTVSFLLMVSCQKNVSVRESPTDPEKSIPASAMNAPAFTVGEMHNMVCVAYWEKHGFHNEPVRDIYAKAIKIADSLLGTHTNVDSLSDEMIAYYTGLGLIDEQGYYKPAGSSQILVSLEPDAELRALLLEIVSDTTNGPANVQWVKQKINAFSSNDPAVEERANGFLEIYIKSSELPYNELYSGGWARADAAGWAAGNAMLLSRVGTGIIDDWVGLPLASAFMNSIKNASCYEM